MDIKKIISSLIKKYDTNNPFQIAKEMGIIILYGDFDDIRGFYNKCYRQRFIHLNNNLTDNQLLLTISHELGHSVLHPNSNTPFLRANTFFSINKMETEANTFAMLLLISDDSLREYITYGYTIDNLASVYGYDKTLIELRLKYFEM